MATSASKTTRKRTTKKATTTEAVAPTAPTVATAVAERPSLVATIDLNAVFGIDGQCTKRDTFKYNKVYGGAYALRKAIFDRIRAATKEDIGVLTLNQRKAMFALIKGERQRYYGEAVRKIDSATGKKGEPLPQLSFESKIAAVAYGNAIREAGEHLRRLVFGDSPAPVPAP